MKKLTTILFLLLVLFSGYAFAAETMVIASGGKNDVTESGSRLRTLTVTCTTDTDGSFSYQLSSSMYSFIRGWLITEIRVINSSTQTDPTTDSDLYLRRSAGGAIDLLHGAGVNMVDDDDGNAFPPEDAVTAPSVVYVVDQFFVEVENNSVDSAVFDIIFIAYPTR